MLGLILFVLYTHPISEIVSYQYHSLSHHSFSDGNQLYKSGNITQLPEIIHSTQSCSSDVKAWMTNNQMQLNNDKTEMILIATKTVLNSDSVPLSINLEGSDIKFANTVRNLGVCLDPTLSFQQQISSVCRVCYLELRRISAIRHYLPEDVTKKLLCALVLSRLDYCNSLLVGCAKYFLSKLQKVQDNAAKLIFRTTRSAHITPMLHSLHWLPTEQRIEYKLSLLCFKITSHQAFHLSELLHRYSPSRQLRSSTDTRVFRIPSFRTKSLVSALSLTRLQLSGTSSLFLSAILPLSARLNLP